MDLGITVTGDRAAVLRLEQLPDAVKRRLVDALNEVEERLEAAVIADMPVRTGAMRSITGGRVYVHPNRIAAVVGVNVNLTGNKEFFAKKAAALEYGNADTFVVRAHEASLAHFWSRAVAAREVAVKEHSRTANIAARRFLRDAIDSVRDGALADMRQALDNALDDSE